MHDSVVEQEESNFLAVDTNVIDANTNTYIETQLINQDSFAVLIEERVYQNDSSYITEIADFMEEHQLEPEDIKPLLNKTMFGKIHAEALKTNRLKDKPTTQALFE